MYICIYAYRAVLVASPLGTKYRGEIYILIENGKVISSNHLEGQRSPEVRPSYHPESP